VPTTDPESRADDLPVTRVASAPCQETVPVRLFLDRPPFDAVCCRLAGHDGTHYATFLDDETRLSYSAEWSELQA
jgi:hypothetical protein